MWEATVMVRPNAGHPQYWELEAGWLVVYLTGGDRESAAKRAETLAGLLWFDVVDSRIDVVESPAYPGESGLRQAYNEARTRGLSWSVVACPTGMVSDVQ